MSDRPRVPIGDVLPGMGLHPLDEGEVPLSAFVLVKLLDADSDPQWSFRTTEPPNLEEILGALIVQVDLLKASISGN